MWNIVLFLELSFSRYFIGDEDILINLAKNQNLSELNINEIIEKGTYLARKNLINSHELTPEQKVLLLDKMKEHKNLYSDLMDLIK